MKLGFIGCGNMASAMMGGMIQNQIVKAEEIIGADVLASSREKIKETLGIHVTADNKEVIQQAEVVILSIKPQYCQGVIEEIREYVKEGQLIITIIPGKTLAWLGE
ncbi:MAG: NAD(P)-binding domain-containing protein, partial [Lachnospiraceae bacterium]